MNKPAALERIPSGKSRSFSEETPKRKKNPNAVGTIPVCISPTKQKITFPLIGTVRTTALYYHISWTK
jgi:hypothetical protein